MIYFLNLRRFLAVREAGEEKENIFSGDRSIHSPLQLISISYLYYFHSAGNSSLSLSDQIWKLSNSMIAHVLLSIRESLLFTPD